LDVEQIGMTRLIGDLSASHVPVSYELYPWHVKSPFLKEDYEISEYLYLYHVYTAVKPALVTTSIKQ
jgi:hypothetical protein